jgi:hypothetical protein
VVYKNEMIDFRFSRLFPVDLGLDSVDMNSDPHITEFHDATSSGFSSCTPETSTAMSIFIRSDDERAEWTGHSNDFLLPYFITVIHLLVCVNTCVCRVY